MGHHHQDTMSDDDSQFNIETADAGAAAVQSVEAGQIRANGYIVIKGKPCKVKSVSVSKTGKHGHAKCKFAATDIFTGATCEELCPSTHTIDVPFVTKTDYSVMGLEDDYIQLMSEDGDMRADLQLPNLEYKTEDDNQVSELIKEYVAEVDGGASIDIQCTVMSAIGKEKVVSVQKKDA